MRFLSHARFFFLLLWLALMLGCSGLPSLKERSESTAFPVAQMQNTSFARAIAPLLAAHPEKNGIYALDEPADAFASRILLTRYAERSIDVQYYIWNADMTGIMLFEALHEAANRGVRVRLLLDDNNTGGLDEILSMLDSHPNIEVRLFNPFVVRKPRLIGYVSDFSRANRRMHNKSFTVDNHVTIVGGRNIGDEYFGASPELSFADLDVLTIGPIVEQVSHDFDRYWQSKSAYPVSLIVPKVAPERLKELADRSAKVAFDPAARKYMHSLHNQGLLQKLTNGQLELLWADIKMVSDDPRKGLDKAKKEGLLATQLQEIIGTPQTDVELISPYFVPTKAGTDAFARIVQNGVEVRVLTNSLAATDVAAVHAGYAKRRKALIQSGVELYEMRRTHEKPKRRKSSRIMGSSGSSLHAKTFAIDRNRVFVGSFNFDPRSANLNTELGFIIDSPALAAQIREAFEEDVPYLAYRVEICASGHLCWVEINENQRIIHYSEPNASIWRRAGVKFLSWLPIEWLL